MTVKRPASSDTLDLVLEELEDQQAAVVGKAPPATPPKAAVPPSPARPAVPSVPPPPAAAARAASRRPPPPNREAASAPVAPAPQTPGAENLGDDRLEVVRAQIRACETELTHNPEPRRAARLHYEVARLYESPLHDPRRAAAHYQQALVHLPEHLPSIRGARRSLLARKQFAAVLPLFDAEARITSDPRRKAALHLAKGRLLEDALGQSTEARQAYATALELDRSDASVLKAVEQSQVDPLALDALQRTLERQADAVTDDPAHRAALVVERAKLLEQKGEWDRATELYETALSIDPLVHDAVPALKRLHHAQKRWRDLIRILELEVEQTEDASQRAMALYRIGRLQEERLGNREEALTALDRASRENPLDPLVLAELARLHDELEAYEPLVEVLERLVQVAGSEDEKTALLHRMGEIHEQRRGDVAAAIRCYEATLTLRPAFVPALQALGKIYEARSDHRALIAILVREAEHAPDPNRRAAAHVRAAEVLERKIKRNEEAVEHYARALSLVPGYPPAFKGLVRLLTEERRWRELIELYERAIDLATASTQTTAYLFKIAALYEDALGEHARAADTYRRILSLAPNDLGAIQALERTTERAERWEELVEALELEVEKLGDRPEVVSILHRAGEILDERLRNEEGAATRFRRALALDPNHGPSLASLGRIYHRFGRWEDLLEIYRRELDLAPDAAATVVLLQKMAELCEERIGNDELAIAFYRRILDLEPTHGPALRALGRRLRERGEYAELTKVLELELAGIADPELRARAAYRIGEIYEERLGDAQRALALYEQAARAVPVFRPALDALARIRAEKGAWKELAAELEREENADLSPRAAIAARARQGAVWADRIGDSKRAIACFERVLESDPEHLGALLSLERLYRKGKQWEALANVYVTLARVLADTNQRVAALRELGRIRELHGIGTREDLETTYENIVALSGDDPSALEALERLAIEHGDEARLAEVEEQLAQFAEDPRERAAHRTRLAEALERRGDPASLEMFRSALAEDPENIGATRGLSRIAERMDDPVALAEAARREAQIAHDGKVAAPLLVRSARVRCTRLSDVEGAIADLDRALELDPDHREASDMLVALLGERGEYARLADLLSRAAGGATTSDRRGDLWLAVADIQANRLNNIAGAIGSLTRVLRAAPNHVPALHKLGELYERDGQWNEAVNLYNRIVQKAPDRETLASTHLRLAILWDERLGETSRALLSLQAALALDARDRGALSKLCEILERDGDLDRAADAAEKLLDLVDAADQGVALLRLARLERLRNRREPALRALLEAVALEGPKSEAAEEYRREIQAPGDWADYVSALERHLKTTSAPAATYLELADVLAKQLGNEHTSLRTLERGLEATGALELRQALAERLAAAQRYDEAIAHLLTILTTDVTQIGAYRQLAATYEAASRPREARIATEPLVVLGAATPKEMQSIKHVPARSAQAPNGSLAAPILRQLGPNGPSEKAASELLLALEPGLPKLYPIDLDGYGLAPRDKLTSRSGHPLRALADRIAAIVGVEEFDLYIHRMRTRGIAVEFGSPAAILVPAVAAELPEAQQVFLLARPLVNLAQGFHAVDKLTARELEVLLAAAARVARPDFGRGLTSEEFLDEHAKRIVKVLPRRSRKALEENAAAYVAAPPVNFGIYHAAVRQSAARAALLLADDLAAVVDILRRTERELTGIDGVALARGSMVVSDLLRFYNSELAMEVRRRLGGA